MRLAALLCIATSFVTALRAADGFTGDWTLEVAQSTSINSPAVKSGRALIEPDNAGGYLQFSETVLDGVPALRFTTRVQLDGTPGNAVFEDQPVRCVSRRIDANAFEISLQDSKTQQVLRVLRFSTPANEGTLTILWSDAAGAPIRKLVYHRIPEGPLLEVGRTIDQAFGAAGVFEYRIHLEAGQYCQGKVDQKSGSVNMAAYGPDGGRIRGFPGPPTGNKIFAWEAQEAGTYKLVLRSAVKPAERYAITVEKIVGLEDQLRPAPAIEKFTCPRIGGLRKEIEAGNRGAVAKFWQEIEKEGAPIIEPLQGSTTDNLVTFLWRARTETRNVLILWFPFAAAHPEDFEMHPLGQTDVWYRTVKIRRGARFAYQLSPNDPLTFDDSAVSRMATAQADPLNPHHWFENPGSTKFEYQSMVEMPDAKP